MRLDKFLSSAACGSRKELKHAFKKGLVYVNGALAKDGAVHIDENNDLIVLTGGRLRINRTFI